MNPEELALPEGTPAVAAPARLVRLAAKPVMSPEEVLAAAYAKQKPDRTLELLKAGSLERKLAGLHDAQEMLQVMNTELLLQRTARQRGSDGKSRQAMRVLSITILFALLIAALAAMSRMQSRLAEKGFSRHRPAAESPR